MAKAGSNGEALKSKVLSDSTCKKIDDWCSKFPDGRQRSAVLAALREAQHQNGGWLDTEHMDAVAEYLQLPTIAVYEVASFYSMFETKQVGRHSVSICTNISCMLRGSNEIVKHVEQSLGVKTGETTKDGRIYLKEEEECLAACCGAPMMMINHIYHENLDPKKAMKILDNLK